MTDDVMQDDDPLSAPYTQSDWSLIICERSGIWGSRLRSALGGDLALMCETRSVAECLGQFEHFPAGLGIVEITHKNVESVLGLLWTLDRRFPLAHVIVFAARGLESLEMLSRELGAAHFVAIPPRDLRSVNDIIRRHRATLPEPRRSLTEQILAGLPWGED